MRRIKAEFINQCPESRRAARGIFRAEHNAQLIKRFKHIFPAALIVYGGIVVIHIIPNLCQINGNGMAVSRVAVYCDVIAHGMRRSGGGYVYRLARIIRSKQHAAVCLRFIYDISQLILHKKLYCPCGIFLAFGIAFNIPIAFNRVAKCIHGRAPALISGTVVKKLSSSSTKSGKKPL